MKDLPAADKANELRAMRDHSTDDAGRCAYQVSYNGRWIATRNGARLTTGTAAELRVLVADDFTARILRA